jgi:uracil-DNA glycosylase family 4
VGFFHINQKLDQPELRGLSLDFLHRQQCNVCPLNNQPGLQHPYMEPTGSSKPLVYVLGEAPGADEDKKGEQFVGKSGRFLRQRIPDDWVDNIRFNNAVRCRPPDNRDPTIVELECCRPSIVADIERTKPRAIFGFGNVPLQWALDQTGITKWAGRYAPVKVGSHVCWYFPLLHPSGVMRRANEKGGQEIVFQFELDLKRAFDLVETLPDPVVHSVEDALKGIARVIANGQRGWGDANDVIYFLRSLRTESVVGLDYETNGLRPYKKGAKILTVGLASRHGSMAFPLYHRQAKWTKGQLEEVHKAFTDFLYEAPCRKVVHNLAFEMEWTAYFYGEKALRAGEWEDTIAQAFILDERRGKSLEVLCQQYFGVNIKAINGLDRANLDAAPLEEVLQYNGLDAKYHRLLYLAQKKRVDAEKLTAVYEHHLRRVPTVVLTQLKGVPVDQDVVEDMREKFEGDRDDALAKIKALKVWKQFKDKKGYDFRPSAPQDIMYLFNDILGESLEKADEKALKKVKHPIVQLIIDWKKAEKMLSTYIESWATGGDNMWPDGLLHPILSLVNTRTWRTASEAPKSQDTPVRGPNKIVRKQVRPSTDERVVSFDFAGIQARNVAMESKDKTLVEAFWNKYDIHSDWLERICRQCPNWVSAKALKDEGVRKEYRNKAKNGLVFPSFFGARPPKLALVLEIDVKDAEALHEEFWAEFPDIKGWHQGLDKFYRKYGYVTGLSGFRRRAPVDPNQLINSPIQADESLIVLEAMARLSEYEEPRFQANMEIHDDLTFIWPKRDIERNAEVVIKEMLRIEHKWINVPICVEMSVGEDWYDKRSWGDFSSDDWSGHVKAPKVVKEAETSSWTDGEGWDAGDGYQ